MIPLQPGSEINVSEGQPSLLDPNDDGTTSDDGWALFPGTSAASTDRWCCRLNSGGQPRFDACPNHLRLRNKVIDVIAGNCYPRFNISV